MLIPGVTQSMEMQKLNDKLSWLASFNNWICVNHLYQSTKSVSKTTRIVDGSDMKTFCAGYLGSLAIYSIIIYSLIIKQISSQMLDYMIGQRWVVMVVSHQLFSLSCVIFPSYCNPPEVSSCRWTAEDCVTGGSRATELDSIFKFNRAIKVWVEAQI